MPRIRIHFSKRGYACFISHIDLPILFGRAARRAGLISEMTQGFSPHPKTALCPPLPVGVVGLAEPAEFWFASWDEGAVARWQDKMPTGIELLCAAEVEGVSLAKLCTAATYRIAPHAADPDEIVRALSQSLGDTDALLGIGACGGAVSLSVSDLERCGPSRIVRELVSAGVLEGWSALVLTRTVVGQWDADSGRVVPLMEEWRV